MRKAVRVPLGHSSVTEIPEKPPHGHGPFSTSVPTFSTETGECFQQMVLERRDTHMQKNEAGALSNALSYKKEV